MYRQFFWYLFVFLMSFSFHSCQTTILEPEIRSFTAVSIDKINTTEVVMSGKVSYYNPNPIGGTLKEIILNLWANDVYISEISQELDINVKPSSNFDVPINIHIPIKSILGKKSGLLGGLVNAITQRKIKMKYSVIVTINFAKIEMNLPIEKEEEIDISF